MTKQLKIDVIGTGALANRVHLPSLTEMEDVTVAAICDVDEKRLNETADRYEVEGRFKDYRRMIAETAPDAVYIAVPPTMVFPIAMHAIRAGVGVFIEKPPGITLEQTRNMARAAEKNNSITMVGFNRRFIPVLTAAKKIVEERGPFVQIVATFYKNAVGHPPPVDGELDLMTFDVIHAVDALRGLGGEVKQVVSDVRNVYADYDNSFNALVRFESGALGILSTLWVAGTRIHTFELHAKGISAFVDGNSEARIYSDQSAIYSGKGQAGLAKPEAVVLDASEAAGSPDFYKAYGYFAEDQHFIECLKAGKQPETNFADAVKTMELLELIRRNQNWC